MKTLLENQLLSVQPTGENLAKYPTIIELLEALSEKEEDSFRTTSPLSQNVISRMIHKGLYHPVKEEGETIVMPAGRSMFTLFRGENEYHPICNSSLYRNRQPEKQLLDRLHTCELKVLLNSHPIINHIANNPIKNFGKSFNLKIDYEGLAQHYGIPTRLLDFSNDKWVAAFFAITEYKNDSYSPINPQNFRSSYGVLYIDKDMRTGLRPIGLQYFRRPTAQSGFAFSMSENENLNEKIGIEKIFFRHDYEASCLVYDITTQGEVFFPKDSLVEKTSQINELKSVSLSASTLCKSTYYSHFTDNDFYDMLVASGIETDPLPVISFDKEFTKQEWEEWQHGGKERYIKLLFAIPIIYT